MLLFSLQQASNISFRGIDECELVNIHYYQVCADVNKQVVAD